MNVLLNKRGFTLVELMVAISLLVIVLALGYSYYSYGTKTFSMGESHATVQQDIRLASRKITTEIRNATKINNSAFVGEELYHCIKKNASNKLVIDTIDNDVVSSRQLTSNIITNTEFELKKDNNRYFIRFKISGNDGTLTNDYSIESEVLLNNINDGTLGTWNTIYYTKP